MKPESELHTIDDTAWIVKGKGIAEKIISQDTKNPDYYTRLVKLEKGYKSEETVRHTFCEEVWMLKGVIVDDGKNVTAREGYYACRQPGMPHGPYHTEEETLILEVRYMPKE